MNNSKPGVIALQWKHLVALTCVIICLAGTVTAQRKQESVDCTSAIPLSLCTNVQVNIDENTGSWNFSGIFLREELFDENYQPYYKVIEDTFVTFGQEHIYSFTPSVTGTYYLDAMPKGDPNPPPYDFRGWHYMFFYKPASDGCHENNWKEIGTYGDGVETPGKNYIINLLAGVEYYFLLDGEPSQPCETHSVDFQLCKTNEPDCSQATEIEACVIINAPYIPGIGAWDFGDDFNVLGYEGPPTPGKELIYQFTPPSSGIYAITSLTGGGNFLYKTANGSCNNTGWKEINLHGYTGVIEEPLTEGTSYYLLLDGTGNSFQICKFNPVECSPFEQINLCNPVTITIEAGLGSWSFGLGNEKFARFTPPVSANYYLQVTSASGGAVNYLFKVAADDCINTGWKRINIYNAPGGNNLGLLTAGVTYEFVLDNNDHEIQSVQTFQVCLSPDPVCNPSIYAGLYTTINATLPQGIGSWDNYPISQHSLPALSGKEVFFRFTAPSTSLYSLQQLSGNPVNFYYKPDDGSCSNNGFIPFVNTQPLQKGTTYLIVADQYGIEANDIGFEIIEATEYLCPGNSLDIASGFEQYYDQGGFWEIRWYKNNQLIPGEETEYLHIENIPVSAYGDTYYATMTGLSYQYEWLYFESPVYKVKFRSFWTGAISTEWEEPGNWSCNLVPDEYTDVIIPDTPNDPVLETNQSVKKLFVLKGAVVTVKPGVVLFIKD